MVCASLYYEFYYEFYYGVFNVLVSGFWCMTRMKYLNGDVCKEYCMFSIELR